MKTYLSAAALTLPASAALAHDTVLPHAHGNEALPYLAGLAVVLLVGAVIWAFRA